MPWRGSILVVAVTLASSATACTGSSQSVDPGETSTVVQSTPETGTVGTTTSVIPPPPPLTHKQFIRRLDHLCKVGNRASSRRFKFGDVYDSAESLDAYARRKWDRKHGFFELDPGDPEDVRNYQRYETLTRRLRNFSVRELAAARHHDFDELVRLNELERPTRNKRTNLTADMGLRFCGT